MIPYSKVSLHILKKIIKCFLLDLDSSKTSKLLGLNPNTIDHYFNIFREIIYSHRMDQFQKKIGGAIEADESYFWAKRKRWFAGKLKRWRGTLKQPVFGLIKREDILWKIEIYTEIIPDCSKDTLLTILKGKISLEDAVIYTDGWPGYNGLYDGVVLMWEERHYRVNHGESEFSKWDGVHINGIENFWSFSKRRLSKFNGVKVNFHLHLKECEWRYWKTELELEENLPILIRNFYKKKKQ